MDAIPTKALSRLGRGGPRPAVTEIPKGPEGEDASESTLILRRDVVAGLSILAQGAVAWIVPTRLWTPACWLLGMMALALHPRRTAWQVGRGFKLIPAGLGIVRRIGLSANLAARHVEERLQYLREWGPGGWKPRIRVAGAEHVENALAAGRGAILWMYPFLDKLVLRKALHATRFSVVHLSHPGHGSVSQSRFARRFLNPIVVGVENRYLAERIVMPTDGSSMYVRGLRRRLQHNSLISISVAEFGRRVLQYPLAGGVVRFATGAPALAVMTEARLLPVFLVRRGPNDFEVVIEPPLEVARQEDRQLAIDDLSRQYVELLEGYVERDPAQFSGWDQVLGRRALRS